MTKNTGMLENLQVEVYIILTYFSYPKHRSSFVILDQSHYRVRLRGSCFQKFKSQAISFPNEASNVIVSTSEAFVCDSSVFELIQILRFKLFSSKSYMKNRWHSNGSDEMRLTAQGLISLPGFNSS